MDSEKSSFNPSSILDLKAELHKKYESFQRAKLSQKSDSPRSTTFKYKGQIKGTRTIPKITLKSNEVNNEEDLALKKSQLALEAKTRLYEKITSNNNLIDDEENDKYLVDFNRKVLYAPMPSKAQKDERSPSVSEDSSTTSHSSKLFKEIYKEIPVMSQTQTNTLEENQTDQPIHYQNVQFNEIRDHGTGYFAFSTDESKRKEQMDELIKLREQTEEKRFAAQRLQRKRKAMLEARLAKVCERRNIDKSVVQAYIKTEESTEEPKQEENVDLSSIPLPETTEVSEKKVKIRPWDVGKSDFPFFIQEKCKTKSQTEWIEDKRSERPSEFAPPSSYR